MQIFVKTLTGRKRAFSFKPEVTILTVKQHIQETEGIDTKQIRLIYAGQRLDDTKTLAQYNVAAGMTIHMVLQLRGG